MTSVLLNVSARAALKTLQTASKALETSQARVATGVQVAAAKDNAAYWSIATTMRADNSTLKTVQDALGLGAAKMDVAYTAMTSALDVVDGIKAKLVASREPGVDKAKIQAEIGQMQSQLRSIASSASFSGENWLSADSASPDYAPTRQVVSSFTRADDGTVTVSTIKVDVTRTELFNAADQSGILDSTFTTTGAASVTESVSSLDITAAGLDDTDLEQMIAHVDEALRAMTSAASGLGALKSRVEMQSDFVATLMDGIVRGVGQLVDADMTEESTRLEAYKVQQKLGVETLSIANSNARNMLTLFRS